LAYPGTEAEVMVTVEVAVTVASTAAVIIITEAVVAVSITSLVVTSVSMEGLPETAITLEVDEDEVMAGEANEEAATVAAEIGGVKIKTKVISLRASIYLHEAPLSLRTPYDFDERHK